MDRHAPRRFYKLASTTPDHGVRLDERTLRTPGGAVFVAPTAALADAVAAEWNAQGEHIVPASMPLTQLAFAAIDWTAKSRTQQIDYIASFAETDLLAHRADSPTELIARQAAAWDPLLSWLDAKFAVALPVVTGVMAAPVDPAAIQTVRGIAGELGDFHLAALAQATGQAGSVVIGLALLAGRIDAAAAFRAAALDNLWSLERWGDDEEARAKLDSQRAALENVASFIGALGKAPWG